jgi:hypothetical protein
MTSRAGDTPSRRFAHFHRVLGELLRTLVRYETTAWLEPGPHTLRDEGRNDYARALYLTNDLSPYRDALAELARVRDATLRELGDLPAQELVLPVVREGAKHARVHTRERSHTRWAQGPAVRGSLARMHDALASRIALTAPQSGSDDPYTQQERARLRELRDALTALSGAGLLRLRTRITRHHAQVYGLNGESETIYIPKSGLVLVGPSVTSSHGDALRKGRTDRITLTPLARWGDIEAFDGELWRAELERRAQLPLEQHA